MASSGARDAGATARRPRSETPSITTSLMTWGLPLLVILGYLALASARDLRLNPWLIPSACAIVALLALPLCLPSRFAPRWNARTILINAAVLRIVFVLRPPELSDDIYRYLWDGDTVLHGNNPFALAPADATPTTPELAALQAKVNHPELITIYPPAAQLLFAGARAVHGGTTGAKALFALLDLGACALLLAWLRRSGVPTWRLALYAWHPLPILEIAGSGHIDGAAALALLAALFMLARWPRSQLCATASGALFALAVMIKLFPIVLLPAALLLAGRRRMITFLGAALLVAVGLCAPFLPDLHNGLDTLSTYAHRWEFGSWTFRALRRLSGSGDLARRALASLFAPAWLGVSIVLVRKSAGTTNRTSIALGAAYAMILSFLLLTPTLNPWYALPLVALFPLVTDPIGVTLSGSVFLGYVVLPRYALRGEWVESDGAVAAIFFLPMLAAVTARLLKGAGRGKPVATRFGSTLSS